MAKLRVWYIFARVLFALFHVDGIKLMIELMWFVKLKINSKINQELRNSLLSQTTLMNFIQYEIDSQLYNTG